MIRSGSRVSRGASEVRADDDDHRKAALVRLVHDVGDVGKEGQKPRLGGSIVFAVGVAASIVKRCS